MKEYAKKFYGSRSWKNTRAAYLKSVGRLCELCLKEGVYTPAEAVHHKVFITPENINDPNITLSWDNLMAVCRKHHEELHEHPLKTSQTQPGQAQRIADPTRPPKRYIIDEDGKVIIL